MTESVVSLALGLLAVCILIVGVVILFSRRGQSLSLVVKGFGVSVSLQRDADPTTKELNEISH